MRFVKPSPSSISRSGGAPRPGLRPPGRSAALVAVAYLLVGGLWLLYGDVLAAALGPSFGAAVAPWKGWILLILTTAALYFVLRFEFGRRAGRVGALHRAHERLRRHAEGTPLALVEWDSRFRVSHWSPAAGSLFGWTAEEALGRPWVGWELVHSEERDSLRRFLDELGSRAPGGALLVQRNAHKNGEEMWCEWYISWTRDAHGNVTSILALVNDITPDREAMSRMQERNRELEVKATVRTRELAAARRDLRAFTHSLANDLRAPVRAVIDFAEELRNEVADDLHGEARRQLVYLTAAGKQLDHLIEDLLEYAELGTREVDREPVELTEITRKAARRLAETYPEAASAISPPRGATIVLADAELLEEVLYNLLENALQYRDPHRPARILVHGQSTDQEVKVRVQDNGPGVPPEHRDRVFRLFERLQSRENHPGSGMGLAIVRRAMDLMGGTVSIEDHTGPGTTFLLRFPARADALERAMSGSSGAEDRQKQEATEEQAEAEAAPRATTSGQDTMPPSSFSASSP